MWSKVFKNKNGPSKICGRQPFKKLTGYGLLKQILHILLGLFLNTLPHIWHINKSYIRLDINCDWFWFFLLIRCFLVLSNSCIKSLPSGWLRRGLLTFCNLPFCYCALKWDLFIYFIAHITFYHEGYYTKVKG